MRRETPDVLHMGDLHQRCERYGKAMLKYFIIAGLIIAVSGIAAFAFWHGIAVFELIDLSGNHLTDLNGNRLTTR